MPASPASALCPLACTLLLLTGWLEHLWVGGGHWESVWGPAAWGGGWLTLDLRLVHDEVTGGPAALELLCAALLGTELLVLSLVQGEPCGGEATVAGSTCKGCQRVLLGMMRERKGRKSLSPLAAWTLDANRICVPTAAFSITLPTSRVPKLH